MSINVIRNAKSSTNFKLLHRKHGFYLTTCNNFTFLLFRVLWTTSITAKNINVSMKMMLKNFSLCVGLYFIESTISFQTRTKYEVLCDFSYTCKKLPWIPWVSGDILWEIPNKRTKMSVCVIFNSRSTCNLNCKNPLLYSTAISLMLAEKN